MATRENVILGSKFAVIAAVLSRPSTERQLAETHRIKENNRLRRESATFSILKKGTSASIADAVTPAKLLAQIAVSLHCSLGDCVPPKTTNCSTSTTNEKTFMTATSGSDDTPQGINRRRLVLRLVLNQAKFLRI